MRTPSSDATLALAHTASRDVAPSIVDGLLPDRACTPGGVETTDLRLVCGTATRDRRGPSSEQ
jgi:hypothetical protein